MSDKIKVNEEEVVSAIGDLEYSSNSSSIAAEEIAKIVYDSQKLKPSIQKQMNEVVEELAEQIQHLNTDTETFIQNLNSMMEKIKEFDKGSDTLGAFSDDQTYSSNSDKDVWGLLQIFKEAGLMSGASIFSSATIESAGTFYPVFPINEKNPQTWNSREEWQNSLIEKYKIIGYSEEEAKELAEYEMASQEYAATGANVFGKDKVALSALYEGRREIIKNKIESGDEQVTDNSDDDIPDDSDDDIPDDSDDKSNRGGNSGGQTPDNPSNPQVTTTSAIKARVETPTPTEQQKVEEVLPSDTPSSDNVETPSIDENNNQISNDSNNNANVDIPPTDNNSNSNNNNVTTNPGTNPGVTPPVNSGSTSTPNNSVNYNPGGNTYYGSRNNSGSSYNSGNYGNSESSIISNPVTDAENISTTTPSAPESDTNIVDKSGEELDVISIDRDVSSEPTTSSGGVGKIISASLGVGAAAAAAVAGIKLKKNKKEKENTSEDESSEDINSFSYLNNYQEDNQNNIPNLNEELE